MPLQKAVGEVETWLREVSSARGRAKVSAGETIYLRTGVCHVKGPSCGLVAAVVAAVARALLTSLLSTGNGMRSFWDGQQKDSQLTVI